MSIIDDDLDLAIYESSEQRSQNWVDVRLGRFTASEFWRLMSTPKGKPTTALSDTAITYVEEKIAELLTRQQKVVTGWALDWGTEQEPNAKAMFEEVRVVTVMDCGFVAYGDHAGGSPDGIIKGTNDIIEIKCPYNSEHHVQFMQCQNGLDLKVIEPKYFWQVQCNLLFGSSKGLGNAHFISYDPRVLDKGLRLHSFVVEPDHEAFELIGTKLGAAIELKNKLIELLKIKL